MHARHRRENRGQRVVSDEDHTELSEWAPAGQECELLLDIIEYEVSHVVGLFTLRLSDYFSFKSCKLVSDLCELSCLISRLRTCDDVNGSMFCK